MSNLRQEYQKNKEVKDQIVTEAAVKWVDSNVVIISEKINRSSVNRLVSSIAKFEETFAPFEQRVPTITAIVDGCEENLQMVLTGKAGDKKTSEVLEYLSFVYNLFSTFFSKDLPVVLKAKMFRTAQENPGVRLDSLTGNFNVDAASKAFAHAIEPSPEELKLIGRVLKSKSIPKIDSKKIASELMALSYSDLVELTTMQKVPLATTPKTLDPEDTVVTEGMMLREHHLLLEASIEDIGKKMNMLKQVVAQTGIQALANPINKLHSEILAFEGSPAGEQLKQTLTANVGKTGTAVSDLFKSKGGILVKQANMAIELFNALGNSWPKVKSAIDLENPTEQDINSVKGVLTKAASSNIFKKAAQFAGVATKPYPGLEPEDVINAILAPQEQATESKDNKNKSVLKEQEPTQTTDASSPTQQQPATTDNNSGPKASLEKINKAMTALHQFATKSSAVQSSPTDPTTGTQPQGQQNQSSSGTTGTGASTGANEKQLNSSGTTMTPGEADMAVKGAMVALGTSKESTKNTIKQVVAALQKAGYKITK
jgi:hypothetical protein